MHVYQLFTWTASIFKRSKVRGHLVLFETFFKNKYKGSINFLPLVSHFRRKVSMMNGRNLY